MAKFPIARTQATQPGTTQAVRAQLDTGTGQELIGQAVTQLGTKIKSIADNRSFANGVAEYNNIINTYNESLGDKSPDEYLEGFQELETQINDITKGMSREASEALRNKFTVWNEVNRAGIATLVIRQNVALAKQEIPDQLGSFIMNGQIDEGNALIEEYGKSIFSPEEVKLWKNEFQDMQDRSEIFRLTNIAAELPTPENLKAARKVIDENSKSEAERFQNLNRLETRRGQERSRNDEADKAAIADDSLRMGDIYSKGGVFAEDPHPALTLIKQDFNNRVTNGSLDVSTDGGLTHDRMMDQILRGKFFEEVEITSAYASGMSTAEYQEVKEKNEQNKKITIKMRLHGRAN